MIKKILPVLILAACVPGTAGAVSGLVAGSHGNTYAASVTITGNSNVTSYTSSSANTGGNVVGSGGSVTGDVSASASSETQVGEGGGTATVHTETTVNGETTEKTVTKDWKDGEEVDLHVTVEADTEGSKITVQGGEEIGEGASSTREMAGETEVEQESFLSTVAETIVETIASVIDFLWFW